MKIRTWIAGLMLASAVVPLLVSLGAARQLLGLALGLGVNPDVELSLGRASRYPLALREQFYQGLARTAAALAADPVFAAALRAGDRESLRAALDPLPGGLFQVEAVQLAPPEPPGAPLFDAHGRECALPVDLGPDESYRLICRVRESDALARDQELLAGVHRSYRTLADSARSVQRRLLATYLAVAVAAAALALGLAFAAARRLMVRLDRLVEATRRVGRGESALDLPVGAGDELGELERALQSMSAEIRASQTRIGQLERTAAWREVARRLAHEIKNPLTPVKLMAQELRLKYRGDDPAYRQLLESAAEIIGEEVDVLHRLVEDFSALARESTPRLAREDLAALWNEYAGQAAELHPDTQIRTTVEPGLPPVLADRMLLRRVLANVLANARQAAGGAARIEAALSRRGGGLELAVRDHGPGVPAADLDRIFEPYFTRKPDGTGLGLAIVRKILADHGGSASARLPEGGGLEIVLRLPAAAEEEP